MICLLLVGIVEIGLTTSHDLSGCYLELWKLDSQLAMICLLLVGIVKIGLTTNHDLSVVSWNCGN